MKRYYTAKDVRIKDESTCISLVVDLGTDEDIYLGIFDEMGVFMPNTESMCFDMDDIKEILKVQQQIFHSSFHVVYTTSAL